jgi:uncharacterized protein YoaH (UPF0181 family)
MSMKKAAKKLAKSLGRTPSDGEVCAYIAQKLREKKRAG